MPRTARLSLAITLLWIVLISASVRATCPGPITLDQHFANIPVIFVGRAIAKKTITAQRPWTTVTTFEVEDVWKGQPEKTRQITTCGGEADGKSVTCGEAHTFEIGARYVVFASGEPLQAGCQPTERVDRAAETLRWLAGKPHSTPVLRR